MVLFKRKPVQVLPAPDIRDGNVEVWHIPQTGEIFTSYDDYLARMDFYKQRRFICQITGQSHLSFFDALTSERAGAAEVEQAFPEALKEPVLRRVQFQTVSRIDHLVDMVYEEFKADYWPGESVIVEIYTGEKLQGVVRDKIRFASKALPDGTQSQPFLRYSVSLDDRPNEEATVLDKQICRDRRVFTKAVLRSFIKKTVTREAWNGAPWLVKHEVAQQYRIDTRVPQHLRYDHKVMERKQLQAQKRALQPADMNGNHEPVRLPELKPAPKSHKAKQSQAQTGHTAKGKQVNGTRFVNMGPPPHTFQLPIVPKKTHKPGVTKPPAKPPTPSPPPPPPPPKYPIEDLQLEPRPGVIRPSLKFLCWDPPSLVDTSSITHQKFDMKSVGPLLETWDTLNVYCEIFKLDSFTFDDYVEALSIESENTPTQLLEEIHCSVLKVLVSSEQDGGKVEIRLPELEEDEEGDGEESDAEATPTPEPEPKPAARATRSSLAKLEAERLAAEAAAAEKEQALANRTHLTPDLLAGFDWIDHLRKRHFQDGGWVTILVGLLHQLSKNERQTKVCEDLLALLVPVDLPPTQDTVRQQYARLDVNARVRILQIICMLTTETKAIRAYMEDCSEQMTKYRKEKIEWQRQRKQVIEELRPLHDQKKILLPDNMPPSPPPEPGLTEDTRMTEADDSPAEIQDPDDSDEDAHSRRGLRRGRDRAVEAKRKREEELERKRMAELAAKVPKQSKEFLKLVKEIQKKEDFLKKCEDEVAIIDNDLREADCPRTRVLGKDRFWNRYYWFERNGMPYGGLPDSSTASAGYANGCIWVQGPDPIEQEGYINLPADLQNEYKAKFKMTIPERKKLEEGNTSVYTAYEWGYISEPEELEQLLAWLDPRGFNELKLRKEILAFKDKIVKNMENRTAYLTPPPEKKKDDAKRMSTRTRAQPTPEPSSYRCQAWVNSMALEDLGHLHSEPPPPPRSRKQARKREAPEPLELLPRTRRR